MNIEKDLLTQALEHGIISFDEIRKRVEEMKLKDVLEKYEQDKATNKVWQAQGKNDTRWKFKKEDGKIVAKTSEEKLKQAYIDYYVEKKGKTIRDARKITFEEMFNEWVAFQQARPTISSGTIYKYQTDFNRCFKDRPFSKMSIVDIDEDDISDHLTNLALELHLKQQAIKNISGYIKNSLTRARKEKLINANPFDCVELKEVLDYCIDSINYDDDEQGENEEKERVLSCQEMNALFLQLFKDQQAKPNYLPYYCIEACLYSGMRVGEVVALKWSDIRGGELHIKRSEHRITIKGQPTTFKIGPTKNKKSRVIPISQELQNLFDKLERLQMSLGIESEFIFEGVDGRTKAPHVSNACFRETRRAFGENMGIHAIRRTFSSNLHKQGVPMATITKIMGHSPIVNEKHYNYDVASMQEKISFMTNAFKNPNEDSTKDVA